MGASKNSISVFSALGKLASKSGLSDKSLDSLKSFVPDNVQKIIEEKVLSYEGVSKITNELGFNIGKQSSGTSGQQQQTVAVGQNVNKTMKSDMSICEQQALHSAKAESGPISVKCPGCGAKNIKQTDKEGVCEFCGSAI